MHMLLIFRRNVIKYFIFSLISWHSLINTLNQCGIIFDILVHLFLFIFITLASMSLCTSKACRHLWLQEGSGSLGSGAVGHKHHDVVSGSRTHSSERTICTLNLKLFILESTHTHTHPPLLLKKWQLCPRYNHQPHISDLFPNSCLIMSHLSIQCQGDMLK